MYPFRPPPLRHISGAQQQPSTPEGDVTPPPDGDSRLCRNPFVVGFCGPLLARIVRPEGFRCGAAELLSSRCRGLLPGVCRYGLPLACLPGSFAWGLSLWASVGWSAGVSCMGSVAMGFRWLVFWGLLHGVCRYGLPLAGLLGSPAWGLSLWACLLGSPAWGLSLWASVMGFRWLVFWGLGLSLWASVGLSSGVSCMGSVAMGFRWSAGVSCLGSPSGSPAWVCRYGFRWLVFWVSCLGSVAMGFRWLVFWGLLLGVCRYGLSVGCFWGLCWGSVLWALSSMGFRWLVLGPAWGLSLWACLLGLLLGGLSLWASVGWSSGSPAWGLSLWASVGWSSGSPAWGLSLWASVGLSSGVSCLGSVAMGFRWLVCWGLLLGVCRYGLVFWGLLLGVCRYGLPLAGLLGSPAWGLSLWASVGLSSGVSCLGSVAMASVACLLGLLLGVCRYGLPSGVSCLGSVAMGLSSGVSCLGSVAMGFRWLVFWVSCLGSVGYGLPLASAGVSCLGLSLWACLLGLLLGVCRYGLPLAGLLGLLLGVCRYGFRWLVFWGLLLGSVAMGFRLSSGVLHGVCRYDGLFWGLLLWGLSLWLPLAGLPGSPAWGPVLWASLACLLGSPAWGLSLWGFRWLLGVSCLGLSLWLVFWSPAWFCRYGLPLAGLLGLLLGGLSLWLVFWVFLLGVCRYGLPLASGVSCLGLSLWASVGLSSGVFCLGSVAMRFRWLVFWGLLLGVCRYGLPLACLRGLLFGVCLYGLPSCFSFAWGLSLWASVGLSSGVSCLGSVAMALCPRLFPWGPAQGPHSVPLNDPIEFKN
ncbi:hypothetical protein C7M84_018053 [Penaeus vannamei]|uniref:Uncharacterized protein n=1 Tax=Penaeus vannamei TaxID=6689 RepID=A0A423SIJ7_PENVA|nr:hypothetical protein C7M84_018053 [Penaeus vannamei]